MIYTKTDAHHGIFDKALFRNLSEAQLEPNSIYWYDQHDHVIRATPFPIFLNDIHWEHLRNDPTAKIFMFYGDEYFNMNDVHDWCETIKLQRINPSQIYLATTDENWTKWVTDRFAEAGIVGVNVQPFNLLMGRCIPQEKLPTITNRFSALSRNFTDWRLHVYGELVNRDLLKHFEYTFNNICPYGEIETFEHDKIRLMLNSMGYDSSSEKFESWISNIPYELPTSVLEKMAQETMEVIKSNGIHLLIESHYDPFWTNAGKKRRTPPQYFSPAFPTEKTYKAIACFKPFIAFSTPYFLKEFKENLGYKTFHPYINESYDDIEDDTGRLIAIVDEIERISKLSDDEFNSLIKGCESIAQHNFDLFTQRKSEKEFKDEFEWVREYLVISPY